jgi:hypothetical protein
MSSLSARHFSWIKVWSIQAVEEFKVCAFDAVEMKAVMLGVLVLERVVYYYVRKKRTIYKMRREHAFNFGRYTKVSGGFKRHIPVLEC